MLAKRCDPFKAMHAAAHLFSAHLSKRNGELLLTGSTERRCLVEAERVL
jgi:hypothetical protein